jgi:hypothetical protein
MRQGREQNGRIERNLFQIDSFVALSAWQDCILTAISLFFSRKNPRDELLHIG